MKATATELNKHPGKYIDQALREPVIVERSGRPAVVMVSYDRYVQLEDAYWGELATAADQEQSIGLDATMKFLHADDHDKD
ncbi:MAG: type II toxin-antitoxin system Phd/YefM family antitoxin [Gammaproteobacteria bacterium]